FLHYLRPDSIGELATCLAKVLAQEGVVVVKDLFFDGPGADERERKIAVMFSLSLVLYESEGEVHDWRTVIRAFELAGLAMSEQGRLVSGSASRVVVFGLKA
ncbi:MAG: hypothetical protein KC561_03105, partial [Myxococcales bacterium]|nr:hypothetical protein [Myxococcales bacterium]